MTNDEKIFDTLTKTEKMIIRLGCRGLLTKQMAAELGSCENTVFEHRRHILKKTGAGTWAEVTSRFGQFLQKYSHN